MKNEKGITIISLVLYITVLLIVVAIVGTISSNFYNNMKKIKTNATNLDDYNTFISFFLEDIKREQNSIVSINNTNSEIVFSNGNIYIFDSENFLIKLNDLVLVNNATECSFIAVSQEEKTIVTVSVTIDEKNYFTQYSTKLSNHYKTFVAEKEYIEEIEFPIPESAFVTKWEIQAGNTITLPIYNKTGFSYYFSVDYGDGTGLYDITSYNDADRIHTYAETGTYTVIIKGISNGWSFSQVPTSCAKVKEIVQWGDISLADFNFKACTNLTGNVSFPNGITSIYANAFYGCTGLTGNLIFPEELTSIGANAFRGCTGLTGNLIFPEEITSIGAYAFYGCAGLTGNIIFPEKITSINTYTFYGCTGLTGNLIFPEEITSIGAYAFYGCTGLTGNISFPETVTVISVGVFGNCTGLDGSLAFHENITEIGGGAFQNTKLKIEGDVNLPLCTVMGGSAFRNGATGNGNWNLPECTSIGGYSALPRGIIGLNIPKINTIRILCVTRYKYYQFRLT